MTNGNVPSLERLCFCFYYSKCTVRKRSYNIEKHLQIEFLQWQKVHITVKH